MRFKHLLPLNVRGAIKLRVRSVMVVPPAAAASGEQTDSDAEGHASNEGDNGDGDDAGSGGDEAGSGGDGAGSGGDGSTPDANVDAVQRVQYVRSDDADRANVQARLAELRKFDMNLPQGGSYTCPRCSACSALRLCRSLCAPGAL